MKIILQSLIISILACAGIKVTYGFNNPLVYIGITAAAAVSSYFIINREENIKLANKALEEEKHSKEKEELKFSNAELFKRVENIENFIKELINENKSSNENLAVIKESNIASSKEIIETYKIENNSLIMKMKENYDNIITRIDEDSNRINNSIQINNEAAKDINNKNSQFIALMNENKESLEASNDLINNLIVLLKKNTAEVVKVQSSYTEKIDTIIKEAVNIEDKIDVENVSLKDLIENSGEVIKSQISQGERANKLIQEIVNVQDKIDIGNDSLEEINDNAENIKNNIDEKYRKIISLEKELVAAAEDGQELSEKMMSEYKKIYNEIIKEIAKLTSKNEYIVNLLMDSYKVLNAFMDSAS